MIVNELIVHLQAIADDGHGDANVIFCAENVDTVEYFSADNEVMLSPEEDDCDRDE